MDGKKDVEDVWMLGTLTMNYNVFLETEGEGSVSSN